MKIKRVLANNRKKTFVLEVKDQTIEFPYSQLRVKPSARNPLESVHVDPELGQEGFTYKLKSGQEASIMLDNVLYYNRDPEYLCELMLHELTVTALESLKASRVSKRELARRLRTSPRHLYRLLDPAFYGKTIDQMVKLLHALGRKVELRVNKQAA